MNFLKFALLLIPIFFLSLEARADLAAEFNKGRFIQSTFNCTNDTACNSGSCVSGMCQCQYGYRDSTEAACDHEMPDINKTPAWALEAALGWIFPAGWLYQGIWPTALARLAIELTAGGMWFGYFWEREKVINELHKESSYIPLGWFVGANLFTPLHVAAWIYSAYYLSQFDVKNTIMEKNWHKDQGGADLVVLADKIQDSARITLNHFGEDDCAIVEGCVDGTGERRLLRFDAYITNIGKGDFVMGLEDVTPEWSSCHQHFHGPDTARYFVEHQIVDNNGTAIKTIRRGHKQGYCYVDSININSTYEGKFGCGNPYFTKQLTQGITSGYSDIYDGDTDCQWIDITDIPAGNYTLSVTVNPKGIYYQDADLTNNLSVLQVEIPDVDKKKERTRYGRPVVAKIIKGPRS
jgi:hypothetical protein